MFAYRVWCADLEPLRSTKTGVRGPQIIKVHRKWVYGLQMWTLISVHVSFANERAGVDLEMRCRQVMRPNEDGSGERKKGETEREVVTFLDPKFVSSILRGGSDVEPDFLSLYQGPQNECARTSKY